MLHLQPVRGPLCILLTMLVTAVALMTIVNDPISAQSTSKSKRKKDPKSDWKAIDALKREARALQRKRNYALAQTKFEQVLALVEKRVGPRHVQTAAALNDLGNNCYWLRQYAKAEPLYQRSLQIRESALGKDHLDVATSLCNLASVYTRIDQTAKAEPLYQRSLAIREAKLGKDHLLVATTLSLLANLYYAKLEYAKAEPLYQRSLQTQETKLGKDHVNVATSLNNLANLYYSNGQYAEAEPLYQRSLEIRESKLGKDHLIVATSLNNLANVYYSMEQYSRAESLYQRSLAIRESRLGKNHVDVASTLNNLANQYQLIGWLPKAEQLYQRSLEIRETRLGKDHPEVATSLNNLASLYRSMGQYAKAEPLYQRSLGIRESRLGKDHLEVATVLNELGNLYRGMGQYAKAEPLLLRGLEIRESKLGKDHVGTTTNLNDVAVLYRCMGQHAKAEPLLLRCLKVRESKLGSDHHKVANILSNLTNVYMALGRHAQAVPLYQRSLQVYEAKLGKDHPRVATNVSIGAHLYQSMGEYAKAETLYRRSLEIRETKFGRNTLHVADSLNHLAALHAELRQTGDAALEFDRARRILRRHVATVLPLLSEKEQGIFLQKKVRSEYNQALSLGFHQAGQPKIAQAAASWLLNGKAVTQEVLAGSALLSRGTSDPGLAKMVQDLTEVRRKLAQATAEGPEEEEKAGTNRQDLAELTAREQELARKLRQAGGTSDAAGDWVELNALRQRLPRGAVFVDIARVRIYEFEKKQDNKRWQPARFVAWITPRHGDVRVVDLGPARTIEAAVAAARAALEKGMAEIGAIGEAKAEQALHISLQGLSELVLHPLLPNLADATSLYLSPDAGLWLAPWAALPLPDGKYAVEKYTVRLLVSGRDLVHDPVKPARNAQRPLLLADPDYDLGRQKARQVVQALLRTARDEEATRAPSDGLRLGNVRRLPYTATEAAAVAARLQSWLGVAPQVLTREKALEGMFKSARGPRVLVLSTHGYFLPDQETDAVKLHETDVSAQPLLTKEGKPWENPLLRCGLLLAGCNNRPKQGDAGDDGVLTGLEIVGTDLRGTELVVLSACETGLGKVQNGEGVAGLRQAFQLAGAEAVVATLWRIPDRQSAQLMIQFFDELAANKDKATALADAQRALIRDRREKYGAAHPFFWAAFTLTGK